MGKTKSMLTNSSASMCQKPSRLKLSDIKSKFIFAMMDKGNFYPCLVLGEATVIKNGFKVYFLRQDIETEIPGNGVLWNPDLLKEAEVSYIDNNEVKMGTVLVVDKIKYSQTPTSFLIQTTEKCIWVPLPRVFLTKAQAQILL